MLDLLGAFVGELRSAGIPVSTTEHLDAARALVAIDLMERSVVKAALSLRWAERDGTYADLLERRSAPLKNLPGR